MTRNTFPLSANEVGGEGRGEVVLILIQSLPRPDSALILRALNES